MSDLPERFEDIRKTKGDAQESPQVYLRADRGLDYGQVMQVMGELNRAGLNRVALACTGSSAKQSGRPAHGTRRKNPLRHTASTASPAVRRAVGPFSRPPQHTYTAHAAHGW